MYLCVPDLRSLETELQRASVFSQEISLSSDTLMRICHATQGLDQLVEDQKQIMTTQHLASEL